MSQDLSLAAKRESLRMEAAPLRPIIPPHPGLLVFLRGEVSDSAKGFLRQDV